MPKELSIGAVVFRRIGSEIKYLLLHYEAGHWDFPKGHVERNETAEQTIRREMLEETGLSNFSILPKFRQRTSYFFKSKGETVFKEVIFYLIEAHSSNVKISFEHTGFKWLPFGQAIKLLSFENTRNVLEKANEFLKQKNLEEF